MEWEKENYRKNQKRSDHRLRLIHQEEERDYRTEEQKKRPMEGYESSEKERTENLEPQGQLLLRGENQRLSAGYNRERKLTMAFSRDKNEGNEKQEEWYHQERSTKLEENRRYLRSGLHRPEGEATVLEDREEKRKEYLLRQLKRTADAPGETFLERAFPFLSKKEETERIHQLEEEARARSLEPKLVEANRRQADTLRIDIQHKEEEQRDLTKKLAVHVTPEKLKKKAGWTPERGNGPVLVSEGEEKPDGEEDPRGEGTPRGEEKPHGQENSPGESEQKPDQAGEILPDQQKN